MTFYKKKWMICLIGSLFLLALMCLFEQNRLKGIKNKADNSLQVVFSKPAGFYEKEFELQLSSPKGKIFYTLDGSEPNRRSIPYTEPIWIDDASLHENVYSMRTDVSTGFDKEEVEKISSGYLGFETPNHLIDKATIIRAVCYDDFGNKSEISNATYFVNYQNKNGYQGMNIVSLITNPDNLFDYENGIYVTGKAYDDYVKEYRGGDEYYWREEYWALWMANYRNRGIKWERKGVCQFFDEQGNEVLTQDIGIRIHGGVSRGYNPKSLNLYARKEYDGNTTFQADLIGTGYSADTLTLFQGGNDIRTKAKDYLVNQEIKDFNVASMNYIPYVLFLNGEYWGVYWLNEKFDAKYFEYYYGVNEDNVLMIKNDELEVGEEDDYKYYQNMVQFCSECDMTEQKNYIKACDMIDIESYIDYYAIMLHLGRNGDWPWLNFGLWRTKKAESGAYGDEKWRWIIFDLNSPGFDINIDAIAYVEEKDAMFANMMTNETFRRKLYARLDTVANDTLEKNKMSQKVDEFVTKMSEPMRKNDSRFYNDDSLTVFINEMSNLNSYFSERVVKKEEK